MLVGGSSCRRRHGRGRPVPDGFFETAVRLRSLGFKDFQSLGVWKLKA